MISPLIRSQHIRTYAIALISSLTLQTAVSLVVSPEASAIGPMTPTPMGVRPAPVRSMGKPTSVSRVKKTHRSSVKLTKLTRKSKKKAARKKMVAPPRPPQELTGNMSVHTIAPGVVHKVHRGAMYINLLDLDLAKAKVQVKPVMAGESFNRLDEVKDQAARVGAIAAVNGNYFKKDGTPLGTLLIDGEWVAGPIFDRTSLGITHNGDILVDRVNLHGMLETSNPDVPSIWVNNINQPRRTGAKLIVYTRRWGSFVRMAYEGCLIAVDASGNVVGKSTQSIGVPYGGFVLSDGKSGDISKLNVGDILNLQWETKPAGWSKVVHAVSGGPVIIRDGKLYVGLKDEHFRKSWTGRQITARTAIGVTADRHLLLATIEGPHTLWDVAKFLRKLGCVDAINLDGGGSTTMVVEGKTVTRNKSTFQRRVASSLVVLAGEGKASYYRGVAQNYVPQSELVEFTAETPPPAPDTRHGYELIETQPAAAESPTVADSTGNPAGLAPLELEAQPEEHTKKSKSGRKRFGWFRN